MITTENYREIYNDLVEETNDFTSDSGVIKCSSKKASDIIREILSGYYGVIDYGISDIEDVDGNVYMIIYNDLLDTDIMESLKSLNEKIVKKGSKWQVQSEKGKNMGTYDTKTEAEERLRQVEYFKHKNESIDDNFKLQHSLLEDIPTFWEWVDDQGLDPDVIEENPDLEEYFRQQYDITYNFKTPEDYDLLDTDVPDDYDDFDFYHHEEELPGYHYVCYFDDDDKDEDDSGDVDTLEKAIEVCDNLRATKGYDCAEIFGPKGDTVATFWEGKWNTNYGESLNKTLESLEETVKPGIDLDDYNIDEEDPDFDAHLSRLDLEDESLTEAKKKVVATITYTYDGSDRAYSDDDNAYKYWCEEIECHPASFKKKGIGKGDKFTADIVQYDDDEDDIGIINIKKVTNESLVDDKLKFSPNYDPAGTPLGKGTGLGEDYYDEENEVMIYSCPNCGADLEWLGTQGKYEEYKCPECGEYFYDESGNLINSAEIEESLDEGARSGIHQVSLQLNLLKELKKNPNYKEDPRWERYDGIYDNIDEVIADLNDELFDLRQDRKWESLDEDTNNESLTEAAPRKTVRVEPVYNGEHDEPTYFSNIKDAYKFANQLIEEDKEIGLDRIYILYNYTEGYINCWVNDERGWRNPESIPTLESLDEAKNDTLNPAIWENEELKPEVKEKLQLITDKFIEKLKEDDIPLDVDDIVIVGSNRNYNYGPQSDIDLHIIADLSQFKGREKELAEKIYQCKKSIFNDKYDPMINGFEVEIYVESAEDKNKNDIPDEVE